MSVRNMKSVFMPEDDKYLDANEYLDHCDDDDFFKFRRRIEESRKSNPIALCDVCYQPVVLRGTTDRTKYFAHPKNSEDCPIKVTSQFTVDELLAMQFNGKKESRAHREHKNLIAGIIRKDTLFEDEVAIEPTYREKHSFGVAKRWRRPDISAVYKAGNQNVVFELQISTTFLDVIIKREDFYRENDTYIVWVFLDFDPEKFTSLDISYANRANAFEFDDVAKEKSLQEGRLFLTCHYRVPHQNDDLTIGYKWDSILADFSELNFDHLSKKIYAVDTEAILANVKQNIADEKKSRAELARLKKIQDEEVQEKIRLIIEDERERQRKEQELRLSRLRETNRVSNTSAFDKQSTRNSGRNSYANRRSSSMSSSFASTSGVSKSFGDTRLCSNCGVRETPRKIGSALFCKNCTYAFDQ